MVFDNYSNQAWPSPKPELTEPGVKYFLNQTLKQCHIVRDNFHNSVFNMGLFIAFLLILGLILLYKYTLAHKWIMNICSYFTIWKQ